MIKYQILITLVQSIKVLTTLNEKKAKMSEAKKAKMSSLINEALPKEVLVYIFKKLGYNSIKNVRLSCQLWRKIVKDFNLVKAALGM